MNSATKLGRGVAGLEAVQRGLRIQLAEQVINAIAAQSAPLVRVMTATGGIARRADAMLALLVYHYAIGVLGSREIEARLWNDTSLRALCGDELPCWRQLRRFRRLNRQAVSSCLARVFAQQNTAADPCSGEGWMAAAEEQVSRALWLDDVEDD